MDQEQLRIFPDPEMVDSVEIELPRWSLGQTDRIDHVVKTGSRPGATNDVRQQRVPPMTTVDCRVDKDSDRFRFVTRNPR